MLWRRMTNAIVEKSLEFAKGAGCALPAYSSAGIETGITATASGNQSTAIALSATKGVHNITVCATGGDSAKLPPATGSGAVHWVKNSGAASCQLFGAGTDTIDAVATATGVVVGIGKSRLCVDFAAGTWVSIYGA